MIAAVPAVSWVLACLGYGTALAARERRPEAMVELGNHSLNGQGVPQDETQAVALYLAAAAKDYAPAMTMLGRC